MSDTALISLILIISFVLSVNLWLFINWRNRTKDQSSNILSNLQESIKKPWGKEEVLMGELSQRVAELKDEPNDLDKN